MIPYLLMGLLVISFFVMSQVLIVLLRKIFDAIPEIVNWFCDFFDRPGKPSPVDIYVVRFVQVFLYFCGILLLASFGCLSYSIIEAGNKMGTWVAIWNWIVSIGPYLNWLMGLVLIFCGVVIALGFFQGNSKNESSQISG